MIIPAETKARDDRPLYAALLLSLLLHFAFAFIIAGRSRALMTPRPPPVVTFLPLEASPALVTSEMPRPVATMNDVPPVGEEVTRPEAEKPAPVVAEAVPVMIEARVEERDEPAAEAPASVPSRLPLAEDAPLLPIVAAAPAGPAPAAALPPRAPVAFVSSPAPSPSSEARPAARIEALAPVAVDPAPRAVALSSQEENLFAAYRDRFGRLLKGRAERQFRRENRDGSEGMVTLKLSVLSGRVRLVEMSATLPALEEIMRGVVAEATPPSPPEGLQEPLLLAYRFRFRLEGR